MFRSLKKAKVVGQVIKVLGPLFNSVPMRQYPPNPSPESNVAIFELVLGCSKIFLELNFGVDPDGGPNVEDRELVQVATKVIEGIFPSNGNAVAGNFIEWLYNADIGDIHMADREAKSYIDSLESFGTGVDGEGEFKNPIMNSLHSRISFPEPARE